MPKELPPIIRSLRNRNYSLFFASLCVSQVGLWMQRVAMGWLVYRLTDSTRALGVIDFMGAIPTVILIPLTGYVLPKFDQRAVLLVTQALLMVSAALVGALTLTGYVSYAWLALIALAMGVINAFDSPVRQSIIVKLVDRKEDVSNAVALNSSVFNAARLIGPSIAGIVIGKVGEGVCFILNAASYLATIFAVKAIRIARAPEEPLGGKREGILKRLRMLRDFPPFAYTLMLVSLAGVFGVPYLALMPAMARTVLGGTPRTMGLLLMAVGAGALTGSLIMAARKSPVGLDRWAIRCCLAFGASVSIFALSRSVWVAMLLGAPVGFFMVTALIACNTFLQTMVDDEHRSLMMSLYVAAVTGIAPFGSIIVGQLAEMIGTSGALCVSGLICVVTSLYYSRKLDQCRTLILRNLRALGFPLKEGPRWEK
ncbi:MAG: MFS transporter [Synergistaceae bacterium]|jgi:MFS family permease|nr:MFS transporter [Synergistaceae bacterium]